MAMDFMLQARAGRLYWISYQVREYLATMGFGDLFGNSCVDYRADLVVLLELVDELR